MKNIYLALAAAFLPAAFLLSQTPCVADESLTQPGVYPDTIQGIDSAYVNIGYEETIQMVAVSDTVTDLGGGPQTIPINWIRIDQIQGLPNGFDYVCHNSDCKILGGGNGCLTLYGTATPSMAGISYPLTVITTNQVDLGFLGNQEVPSEITGYYLNVSPVVGIEKSPMTYLHQISNHHLKVTMQNGKGESGLKIYNLLGEQLVLQEFNEVVDIDLNTFSSGIYIVELTQSGNRSTFKINLN